MMTNSLAVYIHWPFCLSKCPYCDFNSHVAGNIDHDKWLDAYIKELEFYYSKTETRKVSSIFFGGGTPSLMKPSIVQGIISKIHDLWDIEDNVEITLEANPTSVEYKKFKDFKSAGINRVSIGIQSFNDDALKFLGREHSSKDALLALDIASDNFDRLSFDLIYARPKQSVEDWKKELEYALQFTKGHMSLYQLTIEKGTEFYTRFNRGEFDIPDGDAGGELYEVTQDIMNTAGMPAYEISNHASIGNESKHNLAYWRYNDYIGIGPGAHGRISMDGFKYGTRGHRAPDIWLDKVLKKGNGAHPFEVISPKDRMIEAFMMGMRIREGVNIARLENISGQDLNELIDPKRLDLMVSEGYIIIENGKIIPKPKAFQRLNGLLEYLL